MLPVCSLSRTAGRAVLVLRPSRRQGFFDGENIRMRIGIPINGPGHVAVQGSPERSVCRCYGKWVILVWTLPSSKMQRSPVNLWIKSWVNKKESWNTHAVLYHISMHLNIRSSYYFRKHHFIYYVPVTNLCIL